MQLDTRTRELSLEQSDLSEPDAPLVYLDGWLNSVLYQEAIRCIIVLAHHASFIIIDPCGTDITDHVAEEIHADVVTQKYVYGTKTKFEWLDPNVQLELNLAATITETDSCIEWTGEYLNERPALRVGKSTRSATRLVYQKHFGVISQSIVIVNTCKNLRCVNPRHLIAKSRSACAKEALTHAPDLPIDERSSRKT